MMMKWIAFFFLLPQALGFRLIPAVGIHQSYWLKCQRADCAKVTFGLQTSPSHEHTWARLTFRRHRTLTSSLSKGLKSVALKSPIRIAFTAMCVVLLPWSRADAISIWPSSGATIGGVPFTGFVLYRAKQIAMAHSALVVLIFSISSIFVGGLLFKLITKQNLRASAFRAYTLLNNVPSANAVSPQAESEELSPWQSALELLIANVLFITGALTFAAVIGLIGDSISNNIDAIRSSNSKVLECKHTVLVNWGEYTRPMLRQLDSARREGRLNGPVVLLANREKREMDAELEDELSKLRMRHKGGKLEVVCRSGDPTQLDDLDRVAAGTASRLIWVPPSTPAGGGESAELDSLRRTACLALSLQQNGLKQPQHRADVVAAIPEGQQKGSELGSKLSKLPHGGFRSYSEFAPQEFVARVLAQSIVQPGLSAVYEELLLQNSANEIYTSSVSMEGVRFGDAWRYFRYAIPLGVIRLGVAGESALHLSPADSFTLLRGDSLVLLAQDVKHTRPSRTKMADVRQSVAAALPPGDETLSWRPHHLLMIGWNERTPYFIRQIDEICPKGSRITVLSPELPPDFDSLSLLRCKLDHRVGDPKSSSAYERIDLAKLTTVVWLHNNNEQMDDSSLLVSLFALKHAQLAACVSSTPRVVCDLSSPSMKDVVRSRFVDCDALLPTELAAGILVQFAIQPSLRSVFSELLQSAGKEIYMASMSRYMVEGEQLSFAEICVRARLKGEVCIGVRLAEEAQTRLNPQKSMRLKLHPGDKLVVLGEAF